MADLIEGPLIDWSCRRPSHWLILLGGPKVGLPYCTVYSVQEGTPIGSSDKDALSLDDPHQAALRFADLTIHIAHWLISPDSSPIG